MERPFRKLMEPYRLNERIVLKNHITFPNALHSLMQGPETFPAEPLMNEIAQVCASGASLFSFPHFERMGGGSTPNRGAGEREGRSHIPIFDYDDPSVHNYLCKVAAQTHMLGSRVLVNLYEVLCATTLAITPGSVTYEQHGVRHTLDCDAVVVTGGYRGLQQEALAYAACAPEFYMAGDVEDGCSNLQEGNVSAFGKFSLL